MQQHLSLANHLFLALFAVQMVCVSCSSPSQMREAERIVSVADSMDTAHRLYTDTTVLRTAIRTLDVPIGRHFWRNTIAKAYYYLGRNLENGYHHISEAAECYITCDRLNPDNPILRGRVNACMGFICAQQCNDSLSLVFYRHSSQAFLESGNDWYYAQSLLNQCRRLQNLQHFQEADSLWHYAATYRLDSAFTARLWETRGIYFYKQQQFDSALVCFLKGTPYNIGVENLCFNYLQIVRTYTRLNQPDAALPYAEYIVARSSNPNFRSNAYYNLIEQARKEDNAERLAQYLHLREDDSRTVRDNNEQYTAATMLLKQYVESPHPFLTWQITIGVLIMFCVIVVCTFVCYRHRKKVANTRQQEQWQETQRMLTSQVQQAKQQQAQTEEQLHKTQQLLNLQIRETEKHKARVVSKETELQRGLDSLRSRYPVPEKSWKDYTALKQAVCPTLLNLCCCLQKTTLSENEISFCIYYVLYPNMSLSQIADFRCRAPSGIRTYKNRIAQKLGISSLDLRQHLLHACVAEQIGD